MMSRDRPTLNDLSQLTERKVGRTHLNVLKCTCSFRGSNVHTCYVERWNNILAGCLHNVNFSMNQLQFARMGIGNLSPEP